MTFEENIFYYEQLIYYCFFLKYFLNSHNPITQNKQSYFRVKLDVDRQKPQRIC